MSETCIFCKLAKVKREPVIYENENFFSIFDIKPSVKGHALVIPKKHYKTALDIPSTLGAELMDAIKHTILSLTKELGAEGFNIVNNGFTAGGQEVFHAHFHVFPRKLGDGKLYFMKADSDKKI